MISTGTVLPGDPGGRDQDGRVAEGRVPTSSSPGSHPSDQTASRSGGSAVSIASRGPAFVVTTTWRNDNPDTIWNRLRARLGRQPTDAEATAEVKRILAEALP